MRYFMLVGALILATAAVAAAPAVDLELKDGSVLKQVQVVRLQDATYLVQTADALLELSGDELAPAAVAGIDFDERRPPVPTNHCDILHADGTATRHWTMTIRNRSKKVWTELRMGLAPWELRHVDQRSFVDEQGQPLTVTYDPPREKWQADSDKVVRYALKLNIPLAPGEEADFTGTETETYLTQTEEGWRYRFVGDYTEDRLVYLKVKLPQWADIKKISPQPSATFEHEGSQYVMWRRFYQENERFPLEIYYTLP